MSKTSDQSLRDEFGRTSHVHKVVRKTCVLEHLREALCPAVGAVCDAVSAASEGDTQAFGLLDDPRSVDQLINENLKICMAFYIEKC